MNISLENGTQPAASHFKIPRLSDGGEVDWLPGYRPSE